MASGTLKGLCGPSFANVPGKNFIQQKNAPEILAKNFIAKKKNGLLAHRLPDPRVIA
jgi:hypothetical protein